MIFDESGCVSEGVFKFSKKLGVDFKLFVESVDRKRKNSSAKKSLS